MIGGETEVVDRLARLRVDRARRRRAPRARPAATGEPGAAEQGYLHCGPNGAGHFVKMVHNGIEYGLMAAYAEGLNILKNADAGKRQREADAETTPLENPEHYQYEIDIDRGRRGLAAWQRRRLVAPRPDRRSAARVAATLEEFTGRVSDSGEGRWTSMPRSRRACPRRC